MRLSVTSQQAEGGLALLAVKVTGEDMVGAEAQKLQALDRHSTTLEPPLVVIDDVFSPLSRVIRQYPPALGSVTHRPTLAMPPPCQKRNLAMAIRAQAVNNIHRVIVMPS